MSKSLMKNYQLKYGILNNIYNLFSHWWLLKSKVTSRSWKYICDTLQEMELLCSCSCKNHNDDKKWTKTTLTKQCFSHRPLDWCRDHHMAKSYQGGLPQIIGIYIFALLLFGVYNYSLDLSSKLLSFLWRILLILVIHY